MGRKQSKRIPLKRQHRIEKKVAEHNRKMRRLSKTVKKKNRKDPGVPNSIPFKEEILREIALKKQQKKDEEQRRKEEAKAARLEASKPKDLQSLQADAQARSEIHENATPAHDPENDEPKEQICQSGAMSRKYYFKEFKKVVLAADVILEVLDARDPMSCRCLDIEQEVVKTGKRLVLILNKIDLVPKQNAVDWIKYLRREFPTIPFKASTQKQRSALGAYKLKFTKATTDLLSNSKSFGGEVLLKLIGNYSRNNDIKTSITIGIIGLPNVGKSSVINSLKRAKACNVGSYPGITKSMQPIHLDSKVKLLDSPGIIMQKNVELSSLILRNCVPIESVTDGVTVINHMLKKIKGNQLSMQYKLPLCTTTEQLLAQLARKRGILRKGGVPNIEKAAKLLIQDWTNGTIRYYTTVPKADPQISLNAASSQAEIVSEFSEEFDIDALLKDADGSTPAEVQNLMEDVFLPVEPEGQVQTVNEDLLEQETVVDVKSVDDENMEPDGTSVAKSVKFGRKIVKTFNEDDDMEFEDVSDSENLNTEGEIGTFDKKMKLKIKHMKKMKRRTAKVDKKLADAALNMMEIDSKIGSETKSQ